MNRKLQAVRNLGIFGAVQYKIQRYRENRLVPNGTFRLSSRFALHPLYGRSGSSDIDVFHQIFVNREYRCLDAVVGPGLIIDCGANVGYSSAYFLSKFPEARVLAIEPDPGNFAMLQRNTAPYGARIMALCAGVWSKKAGLLLSDEPWGDNREWARTVREAREDETPSIAAIDIGSLLQDSGFDRISILKIDIEGSELEVFRSNDRQWLRKVDNLVIELHGSECADAFMRAIADEQFEVSTCDELTVCMRKQAR